MIGLGLAASGIWKYGNRYTGPIVTANLNVSVLMRNEIFGRLLYIIVNALFAKVHRFLKGSVSYIECHVFQWTPLWFRLGCTSVLQVSILSVCMMPM